jgi:hypothetical protein
MNTPKLTEQEEAPNCWQCRHFAVSWDPKMPYSCRLMGFKTRILPAIEVLRIDGQRCQGFMRKPAAATGCSESPTPTTVRKLA